MNTSHSKRLSMLRCAVYLALATAMFLSACDSSDEPGPAQPPPPSIPPLDPAVVSLDDHHTVGSVYWENGNTPTGGQGGSVDGLECVYPSPVTFHEHTHLSIFLNGSALAVPAEIGIVEPTPTTECHYPLHTHDETGLIHLHGTAPTIFTLEQFARIWGQPLGRDNVAGITGLPVSAYVTDNGIAREFTGALGDLQLLSHREITIQVGTAIASIPQYTWTGD